MYVDYEDGTGEEDISLDDFKVIDCIKETCPKLASDIPLNMLKNVKCLLKCTPASVSILLVF